MKEKPLGNQILQEPTVMTRINELRQRLIGNDDHLEIVDEWERTVKNAFIMENLHKHEGVKTIITHLNNDIAAMEHRLKTQKSSELPATERDALIDVITYIEWFRSLFDTAQSDIEQIEQSVENELEDEE